MPVSRRNLIAAASALLASRAAAQPAWPSRPITIVNPFPPGGLTDTATRAIADRLAATLGHTVVVDNRPGGGTTIAVNAVLAAPADGHTLLMGTTSLAIYPHLQPNLQPRDPLAVLEPIGLAYRSAFVLHVHPSLPVQTAAEFIAYAKANPGRIDFGSSGMGAVNHLAIELMRVLAGIDVTHVPYRGGAAALTDLRAGRIHAVWQAVLEALPAVREGATRALAVSTRDRVAVLAEVPPLAATLPEFDVAFWQGLFAPRGTPPAVLARLEAALQSVTAEAALAERLAQMGVQLEGSTAAALRARLEAESALWARVIRERNIRVE